MIFALLIAGLRALIQLFRLIAPFQPKNYYDIHTRRWDKV